MKTETKIIEQDEWCAPKEWPKSKDFAVLVIADMVVGDRPGFGELIRSAISSDTCSMYFWGAEANRSADSAVFSIAELETRNGRPVEKRKGFMTVPFLHESAQEVIELIMNSYLPLAVENPNNSILVVCGLRRSQSMGAFCHALETVGASNCGSTDSQEN